MVSRIALFMPPRSQYGVLHYFTEKMIEALEHQGVTCQLLEAEYYNPRPFLEQLLNDKPDCTLSFNGLLPDDEGRFFCDLIDIPHVACIVDTPTHFFSLVHSPNTIITNTDRHGCAFFRGLGAQRVLFMPHGVDRTLAERISDEPRTIDVAMFTSLIDYKAIRDSWKQKYASPLASAIEEASAIVLNDTAISSTEAFVAALDQQVKSGAAIDPKSINFIEVLDDLDMYIKGKGRIDLLRAIEETPVALYGAAAETATWSDYLSDRPNITIHDPVPFAQVLDLMAQSKIVLNNSPWVKGGAHERLLSTMASGALAFTDRNGYLDEYFEDEKELVFYDHNALDQVEELLADWLFDDDKRRSVTAAGKVQVAQQHTWDHRAAQLLKELKPLLALMKNAKVQ